MENIKAELLECKEFLLTFLRHPLKEIVNVPDWSWRRLLLFQITLTMATGALGGLLSLHIFSIITQMILMPVLTLITLMVCCLFFYYSFQIFADRTISFRSLFGTVLFANIPFFIFQIVSVHFSPVALVGLGFTALLLIVAFVDRYLITKKIVIRLIGALYVLFFAIWVAGRIDGSRIDKSWKTERSMAPEVKLGE
jgi:hypothetical protein